MTRSSQSSSRDSGKDIRVRAMVGVAGGTRNEASKRNGQAECERN